MTTTLQLTPKIQYEFDEAATGPQINFLTFTDQGGAACALMQSEERVNMYAPRVSDVSPHPTPMKGSELGAHALNVMLPPAISISSSTPHSPVVGGGGECDPNNLRSPPSVTSHSDSQSIASRSDANPRNATGAVVIFVSAAAGCEVAARMFCAKLTHHFAWLGDATRMFIVGPDEDRVLQYPPRNGSRALWDDSIRQLADCVAEYLATQNVLGLAAQPISIVLGDFEEEDALSSAEIAVATAWGKVPGGGPSASPINNRYIHFDTKWQNNNSNPSSHSSTNESPPLVVLSSRSYVEVNLTEEALRATRSKSGVVCSMIVSFLVQILPILSHVHRKEPPGCPSVDTLECLPPMFFTRHGESEYNIVDRLGGDPALTAHGIEDALAIGKFFEKEVVTNPTLFAQRDAQWDREHGFEVWCSQLQRTQQTALPAARVLCNGALRAWSNLNEIHAGVCEDMTNSEVKGQYQMLHDFRKQNKVAFRYPSGESYLDLMRRLAPVILELHTMRKAVLVVAHQAVLRTLLSYFGGPGVEEAVTSDCPHRTVWCATLDKTGCPRLSTISLPRHAGNGVWEGW